MNKFGKVLAVAVLTCTAVGLTACEKKTEEKSATPPAAETTPAPTAETPATPPAPAAETPAATPAPAEPPAAPATPAPEEKKSDAAPAPAPSSTETRKNRRNLHRWRQQPRPLRPISPPRRQRLPLRQPRRLPQRRNQPTRNRQKRHRPMRNLRMCRRGRRHQRSYVASRSGFRTCEKSGLQIYRRPLSEQGWRSPARRDERLHGRLGNLERFPPLSRCLPRLPRPERARQHVCSVTRRLVEDDGLRYVCRDRIGRAHRQSRGYDVRDAFLRLGPQHHVLHRRHLHLHQGSLDGCHACGTSELDAKMLRLKRKKQPTTAPGKYWGHPNSPYSDLSAALGVAQYAHYLNGRTNSGGRS